MLEVYKNFMKFTLILGRADGGISVYYLRIAVTIGPQKIIPNKKAGISEYIFEER